MRRGRCGGVMNRAPGSCVLLAVLAGCAGPPRAESVGWSDPVTFNAELAYLESVVESTPPQDPRLAFLLLAEYLNANRVHDGIIFFQTQLDGGGQLDDRGRAVYLSCLGILRGRYADRINLAERSRWVQETTVMLEQARVLTGNDDYLVRFSIALVYAQLPSRFNKRAQTYHDLRWLVINRARAPEPGLVREVYFQLALMHEGDGDAELAAQYLTRAGYEGLDRTTMLLTSFAEDATTGHTFHPRRLAEVVPGRVFVLSGFEFTEHHFIVSADGQELIAIDAGTRPDSAEAAYRALLRQVGDLPPLTTVFFTHAHWDHIGGHRFFRRLNPEVIFYARDNYRAELDMVVQAEIPFSYFFGATYDNELISDFRPDVTVAQRSEVYRGGTRFELIPVPGGETPDGMFIFMPDDGVLFVGDFIMPFLGAPFFEEGSIPGLFEAMDIAASIAPEHILHGHETLTRNWDTPQKLVVLRVQLQWLHEQVLAGIRAGLSRGDLHRMNLIPPGLYEHPETQLIYLIMRENFINRAFDQNVGYWHADGTGLDDLGRAEYGAMLTTYLDLSPRALAGAIEKMIEAGDHHLAARLADWALVAYPDAPRLENLRREAYLKLKEKYQFANPFKFIIYSELAGDETPQLE